MIVSKDSDYLRLSAAFGHPPKVIWIRTGNCPTGLVYSLLRDNYDEIEAFGQNPRRSVLELGCRRLSLRPTAPSRRRRSPARCR